METIKQSSDRIASSIMPFILKGIQAGSYKEVHKSISISIEDIVRFHVEKGKIEVQFAVDIIRLITTLQKQGNKVDVQDVVRRLEKTIQEG